jgi:hypothetical protein
MFEQELETLQHIIRKNSIGNAQTISLKSILESNIPSNVKSFFKSEIEWELLKERRQESFSTKFNYAQPDIRILQEQIDLLLMYNYTFVQDEFLNTSDRAAHFLFNYLCRPVWTLENFLFDEKGALTLEELGVKFRYCSDYRYYWTIVGKYLASKNKKEIAKDELVDLLRKIDREVIRDNSAVEIAAMTEPFFHFMYYIQDGGGGTHTRGIPIKALSYFFDDKQLPALSEHMKTLRERGVHSMQYDELVTTLQNTFLKKGSYLEKESVPNPIEQPSASYPESLLIPEREKNSIVAALFKNSAQAYSEKINEIMTYQTWDEATPALDHFFTMNDIEPFSREAILLINALQSHFTNRSTV